MQTALTHMWLSYSNTSKSTNLVKLCFLPVYSLLCHLCDVSKDSDEVLGIQLQHVRTVY